MEESGRNALGMCFLPITAELVTGAGQVQAASPGPVYSTATQNMGSHTLPGGGWCELVEIKQSLI